MMAMMMIDDGRPWVIFFSSRCFPQLIVGKVMENKVGKAECLNFETNNNKMATLGFLMEGVGWCERGSPGMFIRWGTK